MSISEKILHLIDCKPKIEPMKELNRDKEVIPLQAKVENSEKHYCIICKSKQKFPTPTHLIFHMHAEHWKSFQKKKKDPINCETSLRGKSISEKVLQMIECYQKEVLSRV